MKQLRKSLVFRFVETREYFERQKTYPSSPPSRNEPNLVYVTLEKFYSLTDDFYVILLLTWQQFLFWFYLNWCSLPEEEHLVGTCPCDGRRQSADAT